MVRLPASLSDCDVVIPDVAAHAFSNGSINACCVDADFACVIWSSSVRNAAPSGVSRLAACHRSRTFPAPCTYGMAMTSSRSGMAVSNCWCSVSWPNQISCICRSTATPSTICTNEPVPRTMLPFSSVRIALSLLSLIEMMPSWSRLSSSPDCEVPSPLPSRQIFSDDQMASLRSMTPSLFRSNSRSASKPLAASVPFASGVKLLNSSAPESIVPLWLRSRTRNPSPELIQPVCVRLPLPSKSK